MDYATFFSLVSILTFLYVITIKSNRRKSGNTGRLPPGPYPLPIIGNIFELGEKPHLSLASLSKPYGPLMSLKLGSVMIIVVSSPQVAKQILLEHDLSFSSRSVPDTGRIIDHHLYSMVWLPVGDQWRRLRRIAKEHLFSLQQLAAGKNLRKEKIKTLLDYVHECSINRKPIDIGRAVFRTSLNVLSNFIFSTDMARYESLKSQEFEDTLCALSDIARKPNIVDFFPLLKPFDPQGLVRKGNVHAEKLMAILNRIVDQRVQLRTESSIDASPTRHDVLDFLLDLSQNNESEFSRNDILHMLLVINISPFDELMWWSNWSGPGWLGTCMLFSLIPIFADLFAAATDTTTSTLEWAMAELLRNPEKLATVRSELQEITKQENLIVEESDISKLPYLNAVIKETLRLHPPLPFLLPRKALCDVEIQGFMVPKDAQILCNVWAIGRDPSIWCEPHMFTPERFLDINIDYKGRDFELIPFGSGRRICPGLPLAHRILHLMLGSLIYNFDWKLEEMIPENMDMNERFGITLHKSVPLIAIPLKI